MNALRRSPLALIPCLVVALAACDKSEAGKADAGKAAAGKSEAGKADAKSGDAKAASAKPEATGSIVDLTMTSGHELLQVTPSECKLDAAGKGLVVADDGNFRLELDGNTAHMVWKHPKGDIDRTVMVMAHKDNWARINGMTDQGVGYDGEITCR